MDATEARKKMVAKLNASLGREEDDPAWALDPEGKAVRIFEARHDYIARYGYPFRFYETKHRETVDPLSPFLLAQAWKNRREESDDIPF